MTPHAAVIGAGVFGAWCARYLALAGHRVTLVDAYGPANGRASSADHSRIIRAGYGADAIYSRWATESLSAWKQLAAETATPLVERAGALFLGAPGMPYLADTARTLASLGIPHEVIEPGALEARWPGISTGGIGAAVYEPSAAALRARPAVRTLVNHICTLHGVTYHQARVTAIDEQTPRFRVRTDDGSEMHADVFVFACGPWLRTIFPSAVGTRLRVTRQEVLYFGVPPGDGRFDVRTLPIWIDFSAGLYGIPDLDGVGFKVGIDRHGPPIDPDTADRVVDRAIVESTREWLRTRFPAMAGAPLVDARVCQYENTSTGDFIIDRHPAWDNVWIVGGGSGHGFKHGPALGRYVSEAIAATGTIDERFALATKTAAAQRSVY